jgi:hypothetical protein
MLHAVWEQDCIAISSLDHYFIITKLLDSIFKHGVDHVSQR